MNITLKKAIAHFFPNPAFGMVYSEALANALDAGATTIEIAIKLEAFGKPQTLNIKIKDDGVGFNDENFRRFCSLLEAKDEQHKGLGRLIYMCYFENVGFTSVFEKGRQREFLFDESFSGANQIKEVPNDSFMGTLLDFKGCKSIQFKSYSDLRPSSIKKQLLGQFLPSFIELKKQGKEIKIVISLEVGQENASQDFRNSSAIIVNADIPDFVEIPFSAYGVDMIDRKFKLSYLIENADYGKEYVSTDVVVDGRTVPMKILQDGSIPPGWNAIFLLESQYLNTKVGDDRVGISLKHDERLALEDIFRTKVAEVLDEKISTIRERNTETVDRYTSKYPHLSGYFNSKIAGLVDYSKAVSMAQDAFFRDQKDILDATDLSDEQYKMSLDHASRILTEYILYREKIIQKIASMDATNREKEIHNLIVPMQESYKGTGLFKDRFRTNAWLIDEKFMLYKYALSDENIKNLLEGIGVTRQDVPEDLRPDLALVFSDDVDSCDHPVDVVVLELKKRGTDHLRTTEVIEQLKQRARRLLAYYPNKIQRMWFFGLVEIDDESIVSMEETWMPLYSTGTAYYKQEELYPIDAHLKRIGDKKFPVSMTIMSIDAFIGDAKARNEVFLRVVRGGIQEFQEQSTVVD